MLVRTKKKKVASSLQARVSIRAHHEGHETPGNEHAGGIRSLDCTVGRGHAIMLGTCTRAQSHRHARTLLEASLRRPLLARSSASASANRVARDDALVFAFDTYSACIKEPRTPYASNIQHARHAKRIGHTIYIVHKSGFRRRGAHASNPDKRSTQSPGSTASTLPRTGSPDIKHGPHATSFERDTRHVTSDRGENNLWTQKRAHTRYMTRLDTRLSHARVGHARGTAVRDFPGCARNQEVQGRNTQPDQVCPPNVRTRRGYRRRQGLKPGSSNSTGRSGTGLLEQRSSSTNGT